MGTAIFSNTADLELADDLVDERDEVVKFAYVGVLQQIVDGDGDERQDLCAQTHDHTMEELTYARVHELALGGGVEGVEEDTQGLRVRLHTPTLLHRLLARETLARSAVTTGRYTYIHV